MSPLDRLRQDLDGGFPNTATTLKADLRLLLDLSDAVRGYVAEHDAYESAKHTEKHLQYVRDALYALTRTADD